jgi:hypothetical protein
MRSAVAVALAVAAIAPSGATAASITIGTRAVTASEGPMASAAMSKRYARRIIRRGIRQYFDVRRHSMTITDCEKGYSDAGWERVICHDVSFDYNTERGFGVATRCGWGKVVQKPTYNTWFVHSERC